MTDDRMFDTDENKMLIAICTRKLISNSGASEDQGNQADV